MPRTKRDRSQRSAINPQGLLSAGFKGLNTELPAVVGVNDPSWATVLENAIYDNKGRVALRKGYVSQTTTPVTLPPTSGEFTAGGLWAIAGSANDIGEGTGTNRMLIVTWNSTSVEPAECRYGNTAMTRIGTASLNTTGGVNQRCTCYFMLESDITTAAAINNLVTITGGATGGGGYFWLENASQEEPYTAFTHIDAINPSTGPSTLTVPDNTSNMGTNESFTAGMEVFFSAECLGNPDFTNGSIGPITETLIADDTGNGGAVWRGTVATTDEDYTLTYGQATTEAVGFWAFTVPGAGAGGTAVSLCKLHEFFKNDNTTELIAVGDNFEFYSSTDDGDTWSEITGSISTTTTDWIFQNFNGNLYATAAGHKVWEYTGTGTFTQVTDSNVTNGTLLAAFGRLWAGRDASSALDYSALLDGTDWSSSAAGSVDTANVWTQGLDRISALAAFGATLVVFGKRHILMYVDGSGSTAGIDPTQMYVVDTVEGTGCEQRDSVVNIGEGDLWYISSQGVQSLARVIQDKTNPLTDISRNQRSKVQDLLLNQVGEANSVEAIYSPEEHFVLFLFTGDNEIVMYDTQFPLEDGTYRASIWTGVSERCSLTQRRNGDILFGLTSGEIGKYSNYRDDAGDADTTYSLVYATPWLDYGAHNQLKIMKQFYGHFYGQETLTATARWGFDFRPLEFSETFTNDYEASGGEWGSAEFNVDEFADGYRFRRQYVAGAGEGQFVQLYVTIQSTDVDAFVAIQEVGAMAKIGRVL